MPTYDYKCPHCGVERTAFFKSVREATESPPSCDLCDTLLEKQVSAPAGFQLKGTGWYQTDFKSK